MNLTGKNILITGGAGFVGSCLADALLHENPAKIIVFDKLDRGNPENLSKALSQTPAKVQLITGDLRDVNALQQAMKEIDLVYHQAAIRITQCAEQPQLAFEVMGQGTFNVIDAAVKAGVKKIVAASSAAVYGMADIFPTPETHSTYHNRTLYGTLKAFNESLLRSYAEMHQLEYIVLRYFNVYGPRMAITGSHTEVMVRWMERIASGQAPLIFGNGEQTMDFVYIDDVVRANVLAAKSDLTDQIFNVGSGIETSLNELANTLVKVMNSNLKPEYHPERAVNPVPRRLADTAKAKNLLGFKSEISLETGLRQLVSWWYEKKGKEPLHV